MLLCLVMFSVLCGCKEEEKEQSEWPIYLEDVDERLLWADSANYADCPRHNLPLFEFYTPDTITLIRDDAVIAEYPKGNAVYERILQLHTQSLQNSLQYYKDRYKDEMKEPYPHQVGAILAYSVETEDGKRSKLVAGTYLVYTYADDAYAPVYFNLSAPTELSLVGTAQPHASDEFGGPYGFNTSQELWDYLKTL